MTPPDPAAGSGWPGGRWAPYPARYGTVVVPDVPVGMSDGVTLVVDVEYPADPVTGERAPGSFPVLLTQNPYSGDRPVGSTRLDPAMGDLDGAANPAHDHFVGRGYIFVTACVRGTGRSEGEFLFFGTGRMARDGVELVHWAAEQLDGSNGDVGLTGLSFLGMTQLFTVSELGPGSPVKAIAPMMSGAETYREDIMGQGMPTQTISLRAEAFHVLVGPKGGAWGSALYQDVMAGGPNAYVNDFWRRQTPGDIADLIAAGDVPVLLYSGWADIFNLGALELWTYLQNAHAGRPVHAPMHPGDTTTGRHQIVMGPWAHGEGVSDDLVLLWFDTWLKGEDTGLADTATPMHLWDLTTGRWVNASSFPMTDAYTPLFLDAGGVLASAPASSTGTRSVTWGEPGDDGCSLRWTTPPLGQGATFAGPGGVRLWARTTGTNLVLIATLFDIDPDGHAQKLTAGFVVGSLAEQDPERAWYDTAGYPVRTYGRFDHDEYLAPGQVRPFDFWLSPRVATIAPGHRLGLRITTRTAQADTAGFSGVDPSFPTAPQQRTLPGTYEIAYGPDTPSMLNLPLLPLGAFGPGTPGPIPRDWGPGATGRR